jgi:replicative DNA helicase
MADEQFMVKRVPPQSREAEQSVVGAMLMDREAIEVATEYITGEDFYDRQLGTFFDACVELNKEGRPVDQVTLQERLKDKNVPPEYASTEYIVNLVAAVPTSANVKYYAQIVAEKSTLRKLIKVCEETSSNCYAGTDNLETILNNVEKDVFNVTQRRDSGEFVPIRQIVVNALNKIATASRNTGTVTGIATGFTDLDYDTS